jgi:hypothetical protein
VAAVVVIVRVLEKLIFVVVVGLGGLKDATVPTGSTVVTTRVTVHGPVLPPMPTLTV